MGKRIPQTASATEVRQAFQKLTGQTDVILEGTTGQVLIGQGVGTAPVWTKSLTALELLTVDNITINGAAITSDTGAISFGDENLTTTGLFNGVDVDTMNGFFNGTFQETFDALVTSDGAIITMSLEQAGTGDLTMQFSDGYTTLDCTDPLQTIALTAGTDTSPQANYIYIPQSTKVLTKNTSTWPAGECIRVAYFLVPSAAFVQSNGCYVNQNWNDHLASANLQGHMAHMSEKLRRLGASWFSGVNANGATASYFTIGAGTTHWLSTSGEVDQLHEHTFPAIETSGSDVVLVVNQSGTAYDDITDLYSITDDNTGTTITNNRYFNLVFWGVVNKSGEFSALMVNLPGGFYVLQGDALIDADGHDVYAEPREFSIDSGTAFLICRATFQMGGTWTHVSTTDLRGLTPATASGSSVNDHGGLGGLTDDDHTQYLLADGTRALTGNMAVDAAITIDGRDLSVDGTKLDGIEALADVTDATNVAAAGAAMSGGGFHDGFSDFVADEHTDAKIKVDSAATAGYLGAASGDGVLRSGTGLGYTDGGDFITLALSHLGIESLSDPNADRILFWDDGATATGWLEVDGNGIGLSGTTLTVNSGYVSRGDFAATDFDVSDFTLDDTWNDLDLDSGANGTVLPSDTQLVHMHLLIRSPTAKDRVNMRKKGDTGVATTFSSCPVADTFVGYEVFVPVDSSNVLQYRADADLNFVDLRIKGWWI